MLQLRSDYDDTTCYKWFTIKRFCCITSGGGVVGGGSLIDAIYYHFHIFKPLNTGDPINDAPSIEMAHQYIDSLL